MRSTSAEALSTTPFRTPQGLAKGDELRPMPDDEVDYATGAGCRFSYGVYTRGRQICRVPGATLTR